MPFELTPSAGVRPDAAGMVRQLSHAQHPHRPAPADLLPLGRSAATSNFAAALAPNASDASIELRFKEEKGVAGSVAVAYDQTVYGLPIWDAGISVRIDSKSMAVTDSHNATHHGIHPHKPAADAPYLPHGMDAAKVRTLLGLPSADQELTVTAGPLPTERLVRLDNNPVQRTF